MARREMEYLRQFGLTPKLMHDPVRLMERATRMMDACQERMRVARLLIDRADELTRREGGTILRIPSIWEGDQEGEGALGEVVWRPS